MPKYSFVIPVYNRPDELDELLESLVHQEYKDFEVIVVEDGSTQRSESIVNKYKDHIDIEYLYKENEGQGFARNYGFANAKGAYFIVLDSDCTVPSKYLQSVDRFLHNNDVDAFGGPDTDDSSFTVIQRAINHTMTSLFTTGGIRGNKRSVSEYHPRSFNMGMKKEVYQKTGGYIIPFMGEDIEFTVRLLKKGFTTAFIPDAAVVHKRRTDMIKFFKQARYFGRARINISRFHEGQVKLTYLFPTFFVLGLLIATVLVLLGNFLGYLGLAIYAFYFLLILLSGLISTRSLVVALLTPVVAFLQLTGYGIGLVYEWVRKQAGINPNAKYIELY